MEISHLLLSISVAIVCGALLLDVYPRLEKLERKERDIKVMEIDR